MKKLLFILIVVVISNTVKSQDIIVTNKNDTIKCKIFHINKNTTEYLLSDTSVKIQLINNDSILSFAYNYFKKDKLKNSEFKKSYEKHKSFFFIGLYSNKFLGYNARLDFDNYSSANKAFNSSQLFQVGISYWKKFNAGIGLSFERTTDNYYMEGSRYDETYKLSEKLILNSYSFNIGRRWYIGKSPKNTLLLTISGDIFSYTTYTHKYEKSYYEREYDVKYHKSSIGAGIGIAYERNIINHINLGIKAQYHLAQLKKVNRTENDLSQVIDLKSNQHINLSRISTGLYISFF